MTGYESRAEFDGAANAHYEAGGVMLLARPMKRNIPKMAGATITSCASCGQECWKQDFEPDPLPQGVMAVCTECALLKRIPKE